MPVDMQVLQRHGISSGNYKGIFSGPAEEYPPRIKKLVQMLSGWGKDGIHSNLTEWRAYHAIDLAWDTPFAQTTPTLVANILAKHPKDAEAIHNALKDFGLSDEDLFIRKKGPSPEEDQLVLNVPVFKDIFVPLVRAYGLNRIGKLFNERNTNPLLEYKPLKDTERNRVACEIITDMMGNLSRWYGYPAILRQMIFQIVKYGVALAFPREEWHTEYQIVMQDGVETKVAMREGIRYDVPDPMRTFYSLFHPITSINTDSGTDHAGYWDVTSYGEVADNPDYWNRKNIFAGTNWFGQSGAQAYFREVYPCAMRYPAFDVTGAKREDKAGYYKGTDRDKAVFLTKIFCRLNPKKWGLGKYKDGKVVKSYDYPVWHRFILAGDDTVVWAEPSAYVGPWFMGYDYDANAGRASSFALECIPWQDELGNILSQMLLTAQQNLDKVVFYDQQQVDKEDVTKLQNLGQSRLRSTKYIGYDSLKNRVAGLNSQQAFLPVTLGTPGSVQELVQVIPTMLSIMERVLQVSAAEVGAQGTHQQSKYELQQMGGAGTNRIAFISSYIDEGVDAWMRQLYDGAMAYHDGLLTSQVSADIPNVVQILKQLGFHIVDVGGEKLHVEGNKDALRMDGFARVSVGREALEDKEAAQVVFQTVGVIAAQPLLAQAIGLKNVLALLEFGAKLAGAPRGFKLRRDPNPQNNGEIDPAVLEAIKASQQAVMQAIGQQIAQPVAKEIAQDQQQITQLQDTVKNLQKIYDLAAQMVDKNAVAARDAAAKQQIENERFAAEQGRAEQEHQAGLRRDAELTAAKVEAERVKTDAKVEAVKKQAAAKAGTEAKTASSGN